ncbi:MAG: hypothetical protein ACRDY7_00235 [Acidimicrobiia bacterium]
MKHLVAALASALAIASSGSAAASLGPVPGPPSDPVTVVDDALDPLGVDLRPDPRRPDPQAPPVRRVAGPVPGKGAVAPAQDAPAPADPFAGLAAGAHAGYGTGTAYSSDADLSGSGVFVEKAFSAVAFGSEPIGARADEADRAATPALQAGNSYSFGSAAQIGTGDDQVELGDNSTASAPPTKDSVNKEVSDVSLIPVLHADLLESEAGARAATSGCVIGSDLAFGQGSATRSDVPGEEGDAERPILSLSEDEPPRAVSHSLSRTGLLPPASKDTARFGMFSETRQTIAPVTLFKGTPQELTIELAGEWLLRATSDGKQSTLRYGPLVEEPDTTVLRIHRKGEDDTTLTAQDILDGDGADLSTPGVEEFIVGEPPRGIGGPRFTPPLITATRVSAAVDVLRVRIPDDDEPDGELEVRVGHMEAALALPAGGLSCPGIAMAKEADPAEVQPGDIFSWTITVANPNDCVLDQVTLLDTITTTPGVRYEITATTPEAKVDGSTLTFEGFRPLRMGERFTARIRIEMEEDSRPGVFTNESRAAGLCGTAVVAARRGSGAGAGPEPVRLGGEVALSAPEVLPADVLPGPRRSAVASGGTVPAGLGGGPVIRPRPAPGNTPRTGGWNGLLYGLPFLAGALMARRLRRRY